MKQEEVEQLLEREGFNPDDVLEVRLLPSFFEVHTLARDGGGRIITAAEGPRNVTVKRYDEPVT